MKYKKFSQLSATATFTETEINTAMNRGEYKIMNIWEIEIQFSVIPVTTKYYTFQINKDSNAAALTLDDNSCLWCEKLYELVGAAAGITETPMIKRFRLTSPIEVPIESFYFATYQDSGANLTAYVKIGYTLKDYGKSARAKDAYQKKLMDW